jgi:hypothetical protein
VPDSVLQQSQHTDLVGFLQKQSAASGDQLCWQGSEEDSGAVNARFYALPLETNIHQSVPLALRSWGVNSFVKNTAIPNIMRMTCNDDVLCPGIDQFNFFLLHLPNKATQLLRKNNNDMIEYAVFNRTDEATWYNSLQWIEWTEKTISHCPHPCTDGKHIVSSVTLQMQENACNYNGIYNDNSMNCFRIERLPFNSSNVYQNYSCVEAVACNCKPEHFTDLNTIEWANTCSKECETTEERMSHPQQRKSDYYQRKTGRARDIENTGIQTAQSTWGAKRVMHTNRQPNPMYTGCPGYYTNDCDNARCDYRVEYKFDCMQCPLSARFSLSTELLATANSPTSAAICARGNECGHHLTSCRFRRKVDNFDELLNYYKTEQAARQAILDTHLQDMLEMGRLRFTQSFESNLCALSVYDNMSVASTVQFVNSELVEFDLHQRETYREWAFEWAHPDLLRYFNSSALNCKQRCSADVCTAGNVANRPVITHFTGVYQNPMKSAMGAVIVAYSLAISILCYTLLSHYCLL